MKNTEINVFVRNSIGDVANYRQIPLHIPSRDMKKFHNDPKSYVNKILEKSLEDNIFLAQWQVGLKGPTAPVEGAVGGMFERDIPIPLVDITPSELDSLLKHIVSGGYNPIHVATRTTINCAVLSTGGRWHYNKVIGIKNGKPFCSKDLAEEVGIMREPTGSLSALDADELNYISLLQEYGVKIRRV